MSFSSAAGGIYSNPCERLKLLQASAVSLMKMEGSDAESIDCDASLILSSSPAPTRVKWTDEMERALLQPYNEAVTQMGSFSDGASLANSRWVATQTSFNEKRQLRMPLGKGKLQSRLSALKRKRGVWKWLGGRSGFTVDESGQAHATPNAGAKLLMSARVEQIKRSLAG